MIYTCNRCGKDFPKRWKLTRHTERQYQCRAKAFVSEPAPVSIPIQISEIQNSALPTSVPSLDTNLRVNNANDRKPGETVKQWGSRLRKRYKELCYEDWEQPRTLKACQVLYNTLYQIDEEAFANIEPIKLTEEEYKFFDKPEIEIENQISQPVIESAKAGPSSEISLETDQTNKEFERLSIITGDYEKN